MLAIPRKLLFKSDLLLLFIFLLSSHKTDDPVDNNVNIIKSKFIYFFINAAAFPQVLNNFINPREKIFT